MVSGEMLFERDYRLRLSVSSPQEGHLYILNEGEPAPDGLPSFNYLFPSPTANEGSSRLAANTPVQFPARSWIVFDEKVTVERLWLVWSETPVEELEEIKGVANPVDRGAITDAVHLATVRRFFAEQSAQKPEVDRDPSKRSTTLRRQGSLLAHVVPLEHN